MKHIRANEREQLHHEWELARIRAQGQALREAFGGFRPGVTVNIILGREFENMLPPSAGNRRAIAEH